MTKEIQFEKNTNGDYEASFVSTGRVTFQALRKTVSSITVLGNVTGMRPSVVSVHQNIHDDSIIFGIDLPVGVNVTIRSHGEIIKAMVASDD